MLRRFLLVLIAALALLAAGLLLLVLRPRPPAERPISERVAGDVEEVVRALPSSTLPAEARRFLATSRPWRAARAMDTYFEEAADSTPELRVLAARAHGGWGDWSEVLALLEDTSGLDDHSGGVGLYLLARAREADGRDSAAIEAYRAFLELPAPADSLRPRRDAARLRLGLALIREGDREGGRAQLTGLPADTVWFRILEAEALAARGDTTAVRDRVEGLDRGLPGLRGWRARVDAALAAGDLAGARALANRARAWASTENTRSEFLLLAGRIARRMGDEAAARDAFRTVITRAAGSEHSRAAAALLAEGEVGDADALAMARVQAAQGLHGEAVDGFERWLDAGRGTAPERAEVRLEYANALFYAGRYGAAIRALRPISGRTSARFLEARAEERRDHIGDAVAIYRALAEEHEGTGTGVNALFLAAGTLHDAGMTEPARTLYRSVVDRYPGTGRMGLAMMRLAGMAFQDGDYAGAAELWDAYRDRYPEGDRALQATYWSARARAAAGDSTTARVLYEEVLEAERVSYYALLASRRLGRPFWPLPEATSPASSPQADTRVAGWMRPIDLLQAAGFDDEAAGLVDQRVREVGGDRATRLALAEALAARGHGRAAVRLAVTLRTDGPDHPRVLRTLYPLPYRTLITEEAEDRGIDPFVVAALIRQESLYQARITSPAGARGLMQIMPATGEDLAGAVGMERWEAELLYHPEINVHLGTRYVAQLWHDYNGSLPSVFAAYNAGPHRVEWWSEYPEYGREEAFTERIPYGETRDYVKILTLNRALYEGLYGADAGS